MSTSLTAIKKIPREGELIFSLSDFKTKGGLVVKKVKIIVSSKDCSREDLKVTVNAPKDGNPFMQEVKIPLDQEVEVFPEALGALRDAGIPFKQVAEGAPEIINNDEEKEDGGSEEIDV
ncbi:MAG: hypothetical protein CMI54_08505 [Parcubacteria group bacterium]|nr:hypothetical protein [Parcubacteria group bacterium]